MNWIFSKFGKFFGNSLGIDLWNSLESYLNMEVIDLFVKILVFVKILSQWRRKEVEFQSLEVREARSSHLKNR